MQISQEGNPLALQLPAQSSCRTPEISEQLNAVLTSKSPVASPNSPLTQHSPAEVFHNPVGDHRVTLSPPSADSFAAPVEPKPTGPAANSHLPESSLSPSLNERSNRPPLQQQGTVGVVANSSRTPGLARSFRSTSRERREKASDPVASLAGEHLEIESGRGGGGVSKRCLWQG